MKVTALLTPYVFVEHDLETGQTDMRFEWHDSLDLNEVLDENSDQYELNEQETHSISSAVDEKIADIVFKIPEYHDKLDFQWAYKIRPFAALTESVDGVEGSWW